MPGAVAHAYNPNILGGRGGEGERGEGRNSNSSRALNQAQRSFLERAVTLPYSYLHKLLLFPEEQARQF